MKENLIRLDNTYWTKKHNLRASKGVKRNSKFTVVRKEIFKSNEKNNKFYNSNGDWVEASALAPYKCTLDCNKCKWKDLKLSELETKLLTYLYGVRGSDDLSDREFENILSRILALAGYTNLARRG